MMWVALGMALGGEVWGVAFGVQLGQGAWGYGGWGGVQKGCLGEAVDMLRRGVCLCVLRFPCAAKSAHAKTVLWNAGVAPRSRSSMFWLIPRSASVGLAQKVLGPRTVASKALLANGCYAQLGNP